MLSVAVTIDSSRTCGGEVGSQSISNPRAQAVQEGLQRLAQWWNGSMRVSGSSNYPEPKAKDRQEKEKPSSSANRLHACAEECLSSLRAGVASIARNDTEPHFLHLPVTVHLQILSYLGAADVCHVAQTCSHMYPLANDGLLWEGLLHRDAYFSWQVVGHLSHPSVYQEASSDLTPKQIYSKCHTNRNAVPANQNFSSFHPLASRFRSLIRHFQGYVPKVVMFGSGLESVPLVRMVMWEKCSPFKAVGMSPGKDGVGSGVYLQCGSSSVNLVPLYASTRAERRAAVSGRGGGGRNRVNKLLSAQGSSKNGSVEATEDPELTHSVQQVCQQASALVLAVDVQRLQKEVLELDWAMLHGMVQSCAPGTSLLVLACQGEKDGEGAQHAAPAVSPAVVAERLYLCRLDCPWQVRSLDMKNLDGIKLGFDWLLRASAAS